MTPFSLTYPPSTNRLWRSVNGRNIKSRDYRSWESVAALDLMSQRVRGISGPVSVSLDVTPPDKRRRDIDNLAKPVLDALVANGVIEGDDNRYVRSLKLTWVSGLAPGIRVTITPIGDGEGK